MGRKSRSKKAWIEEVQRALQEDAQKQIEAFKKVLQAQFSVPAHERAWTPFIRCPDIPSLPDDEIYLNSRYQVNIRRGLEYPGNPLPVTWLSIKTLEKSAWHDWRDLQRIKNELLGPEWEGVELYPAESRLVDEANQFHLWCIPPGHFFPLGHHERQVQGPVEGADWRQREFDPAPGPHDRVMDEHDELEEPF